MEEEIQIVELPAQLVVGMRKKGHYKIIPGMFQAIVGHVMEKGGKLKGMPTYVCHEAGPEEVKKADKEGTADIEVAFPVEGKVEETEEIKCYELSGGKMAKIMHKGPYEECESTYDKLYKWLKENGKEITGPTREVYPNDPREVKPEEILTEIYVPIK